jgi:hypothetical protein
MPSEGGHIIGIPKGKATSVFDSEEELVRHYFCFETNNRSAFPERSIERWFQEVQNVRRIPSKSKTVLFHRILCSREREVRSEGMVLPIHPVVYSPIVAA